MPRLEFGIGEMGRSDDGEWIIIPPTYARQGAIRPIDRRGAVLKSFDQGPGRPHPATDPKQVRQ